MAKRSGEEEKDEEEEEKGKEEEEKISLTWQVGKRPTGLSLKLAHAATIQPVGRLQQTACHLVDHQDHQLQFDCDPSQPANSLSDLAVNRAGVKPVDLQHPARSGTPPPEHSRSQVFQLLPPMRHTRQCSKQHRKENILPSLLELGYKETISVAKRCYNYN